MKKTLLHIVISFFALKGFAQNVGIGTTTPTTKLEIKNPIKSTVKISSNNFSDTSQLIFGNRNAANQGTDFRITSIQEDGLRVSSSSDLTDNNKDTIMQITPTGLVGIRTATPQYPLDVKGDVNVTGALRANGAAGENGQFLRSNGNGTMSWAGKEGFENFRVYRNLGTLSSQTYSFTIPAGVNKIGVEMWGGGGLASNGVSGGSGGYIYAIIPSSISSTINIVVGAGGGCSSCTALGNTGASSEIIVVNSSVLSLTAQGGSYIDFGSGFSQGSFFTSGSSINNISYYGIEGGSGLIADLTYQNNPTGGYFLFRNHADGGDSPLRPGTGGKTGWTQSVSTGLSTIQSTDGVKGSEPGGGGGFPRGKGGNGQVIIYW